MEGTKEERAGAAIVGRSHEITGGGGEDGGGTTGAIFFKIGKLSREGTELAKGDAFV